MHSELNQLSLNDDENRLLRLFRCLETDERHKILLQISELLIGRYPLSDYRFFENPEQEKREELREDVGERLLQVKPSMEPWDYLDEYIYPTLEAAWGEEITEVILGSSIWDEHNAEALLTELEETAEREGFHEPPWFERKDMIAFIRAWRGKVLSSLEKYAAGSDLHS